MTVRRRGFLAALVAAPAVIRTPGLLMPLGRVLPAPALFLWCDGRSVRRDVYRELFGVIGTLYGEGDGLATFNLPDFRAVDTVSHIMLAAPKLDFIPVGSIFRHDQAFPLPGA